MNSHGDGKSQPPSTDQDTFYDPVEDGQTERDQKDLSPEERAQREAEWKQELTKTEEEIDTLRRVLSSKLRHAQELKRKLGISVWQEVQSDLADGLKIVKESPPVKKISDAFVSVEDKVSSSPAYQKTAETLKTVAEKSGAMFQSFSGETRKKMGELRNSTAFKSVEGTVSGAVQAVKSKVSEVTTPAADRERTTFESELNKVGSAATTPR